MGRPPRSRAPACVAGLPLPDGAPPWRLVVPLLVVSLLATACSDAPGSNGAGHGEDASASEPAAEPIAVGVAPVARRTVSSLYSTSATLRADKQATVTARTQGVLRRLLVEEGDRVAEGDPLAVLEDEEQRIEFERASAALEISRRELERAAELHKQDLLSEEAYEATRRSFEETRQAAALAELTLSRTVIRAPFRGRILVRHLDVGATVSNGTAVYDLADLEPLYADVQVPERHVARLRPGQQVRIRADATGTATGATIERIAPAVDAATGTVKITLAIAASADLRPGAFVRVDIVTDTHADALVVPRSALVAEGRRWHLFRVDEAGEVARQLRVRPGFEEGESVEILEVLEDGAALEVGTRVVTAGAAALTDGAPVRVIEEDADAPAAGA